MTCLPALTVFLPVLILGGLLFGLIFRDAELRRRGRKGKWAFRCNRCGYWLGEHHPWCPDNHRWEIHP